ncbi:hypothetical protein F5878DRAFT_74387 [Lentinula raphanica]|uniref:Uncharacterized protein n=1 Tax=Lentinula raphanica TaxID=153919 RepID=A0AA38PCF8_9AGAR|nr:hypothetical protein F5878DRAFT_74387 [Lentinula raphanica]
MRTVIVPLFALGLFSSALTKPIPAQVAPTDMGKGGGGPPSLTTSKTDEVIPAKVTEAGVDPFSSIPNPKADKFNVALSRLDRRGAGLSSVPNDPAKAIPDQPKGDLSTDSTVKPETGDADPKGSRRDSFSSITSTASTLKPEADDSVPRRLESTVKPDSQHVDDDPKGDPKGSSSTSTALTKFYGGNPFAHAAQAPSSSGSCMSCLPSLNSIPGYNRVFGADRQVVLVDFEELWRGQERSEVSYRWAKVDRTLNAAIAAVAGDLLTVDSAKIPEVRTERTVQSQHAESKVAIRYTHAKKEYTGGNSQIHFLMGGSGLVRCPLHNPCGIILKLTTSGI